MILRAPEHPSCFGVLHHHPLSTGPRYPGSSLSSATDLCALAYFSAQGGSPQVCSQQLPRYFGASKAGPCQLLPSSLALSWGTRLLRMRCLEVLKEAEASPGHLIDMQSIGPTQDLWNRTLGGGGWPASWGLTSPPGDSDIHRSLPPADLDQQIVWPGEGLRLALTRNRKHQSHLDS